jgi:hypothetical protein
LYFFREPRLGLAFRMPHDAGSESMYPGFCIAIWILGQHCGTWGWLFYTLCMITVDQVLFIAVNNLVVAVLVTIYKNHRAA